LCNGTSTIDVPSAIRCVKPAIQPSETSGA
jgi:hypothetical protein